MGMLSDKNLDRVANIIEAIENNYLVPVLDNGTQITKQVLKQLAVGTENGFMLFAGKVGGEHEVVYVSNNFFNQLVAPSTLIEFAKKLVVIHSGNEESGKSLLVNTVWLDFLNVNSELLGIKLTGNDEKTVKVKGVQKPTTEQLDAAFAKVEAIVSTFRSQKQDEMWQAPSETTLYQEVFGISIDGVHVYGRLSQNTDGEFVIKTKEHTVKPIWVAGLSKYLA